MGPEASWGVWLWLAADAWAVPAVLEVEAEWVVGGTQDQSDGFVCHLADIRCVNQPTFVA